MSIKEEDEKEVKSAISSILEGLMAAFVHHDRDCVDCKCLSVATEKIFEGIKIIAERDG